MTTDKVLYYPVWVTTSGGMASGRQSPFRWGRPCDSPGEARQLGRAEVLADRASLSFVVRFGDGIRRPMAEFTYPQSAAKILSHWQSLWDAVERDVPVPR